MEIVEEPTHYASLTQWCVMADGRSLRQVLRGLRGGTLSQL